MAGDTNFTQHGLLATVLNLWTTDLSIYHNLNTCSSFKEMVLQFIGLPAYLISWPQHRIVFGSYPMQKTVRYFCDF